MTCRYGNDIFRLRSVDVGEVVTDGVDYVDDVVTGLLEVSDDIHIVDAGLIFIMSGIDVGHVL